VGSRLSRSPESGRREFLRLLGALGKRQREVCKLPGTRRSVSGELRKLSGAFESVRGEVHELPGEIEKLSRAVRKVPELRCNEPGVDRWLLLVVTGLLVVSDAVRIDGERGIAIRCGGAIGLGGGSSARRGV
jgi:hypothetical protein